MWLTREGSADDVVLAGGEVLHLEGRGLVVVEALGAAELYLSRGQTHLTTWLRRTSASLRSEWRVLLALLAVYVIWGSTYLAMAVALETFPPFWLGGIRFVTAGLLLFGFLRARGAPAPTWVEWGAAARTGVLLLTAGNGFIALGQQWVSSSVAAVVVASMPIWMALFLGLGGQRLASAEKVGLLVGFLGVAFLNVSGELSVHGGYAWVIGFAPLSWALGSVYSRRLPLPKGPMGSAAQMLTGGLAMFVVAVLWGAPLPTPTLRSFGALTYLIVAGSLVGFSAYGYLLRNTRPAVATSYAYVNPVVAILLGVLFGGERPSVATALAAAVILVGVALISLGRSRVSETSSAREAPGADEGIPRGSSKPVAH